MIFKGLGLSEGIAAGRTEYLDKQEKKVSRLLTEEPEAELSRFRKAYDSAVEETVQLKEKTRSSISEEAAEIFDAHLAMLEDKFSLVDPIEERILDRRYNAAWAVDECLGELKTFFDEMDDEYMRERSNDVTDIRNRLLAHLDDSGSNVNLQGQGNVILVAKELTPSDTASLDMTNILGIITETGGKNSHIAIMTRMLKIPAVSGIDISLFTENGIETGIDGATGEVFVSMNEEEKNILSKRQEDLAERKRLEGAFLHKASVTKDGRKVSLLANTIGPDDVKTCFEDDAEGIGLFRSEFLYMDRESLPTEEEQYEVYRRIMLLAEDRPVTIRTMDIGGDKELPVLGLAKEENPFLGYRAIRICLDRRDLFKTQIKALLRAGKTGKLNIMIPMISSMDEVIESKRIIEECRRELDRDGSEYGRDVSVGIMIETPAAAILSDELAGEVDFFSIGTNDLIQYTVAVDRGNVNVSGLYTGYHPSVLRLIEFVIKNAEKNGIPCSMCGELASDPKVIPLLIGMGLTKFSMNSSAILFSRKLISEISFGEVSKKAEILLKLKTASEIEEQLDLLMEK